MDPAQVRAHGNVTNALIHLYRAEVGKMTAYRQRLDITTNWSVVTTTGLASFALGNPANSHVTFLFAMFLNYYFLRLEARRFRTYDVARQRVRMMEQHFYPDMLELGGDGAWHQALLAELARPRSEMGRYHALGWRLNRNYLWLYAAVLLAWLAKLDLGLPAGAPSARALVDAAAIGRLSGAAVMTVVGSFYAALVGLGLWAAWQFPLEEG